MVLVPVAIIVVGFNFGAEVSALRFGIQQRFELLAGNIDVAVFATRLEFNIQFFVGFVVRNLRQIAGLHFDPFQIIHNFLHS
jgi:hypothetical protein